MPRNIDRFTDKKWGMVTVLRESINEYSDIHLKIHCFPVR
jgi:hypothetical protein